MDDGGGCWGQATPQCHDDGGAHGNTAAARTRHAQPTTTPEVLAPNPPTHPPPQPPTHAKQGVVHAVALEQHGRLHKVRPDGAHAHAHARPLVGRHEVDEHPVVARVDDVRRPVVVHEAVEVAAVPRRVVGEQPGHLQHLQREGARDVGAGGRGVAAVRAVGEHKVPPQAPLARRRAEDDVRAEDGARGALLDGQGVALKHPRPRRQVGGGPHLDGVVGVEPAVGRGV